MPIVKPVDVAFVVGALARCARNSAGQGDPLERLATAKQLTMTPSNFASTEVRDDDRYAADRGDGADRRS
jgi:hypothetical protein